MEPPNDQETFIHQQLLLYFQQLFSKESLRKNLYIFKCLNSKLQLPINIIQEERKVQQILNQKKEKYHPQQQLDTIKKILSQCSNVLIKDDIAQIKIEGDMELVRLKPPKNQAKNIKKKILGISKNLRHEVLEIRDKQVLVQFFSNAAVLQFISRLDKHNQEKKEEQRWSYKIQPKDPYQSLKNAIAQLKKQRKQHQQTKTTEPYQNQITQKQYNYYDYNYQNVGYNTNYYNYYGSYWQYPKMEPFIRKAVDSEQQLDQGDPVEKKIQGMSVYQENNHQKNIDKTNINEIIDKVQDMGIGKQGC